jgi:hypothetical protein
MKIRNLGQKNYMENIFKCFGMEECKLVSTPLGVNFRLCKINKHIIIKEANEMEGVSYK